MNGGGEGRGKKGVHNGIMFARWPFYPLTMIPRFPANCTEKGFGRQSTRDEERCISNRNLTDPFLHAVIVSIKRKYPDSFNIRVLVYINIA